MTHADSVLAGSYDYLLVALSVVIAIFASYAALDLAGRVTSTQGKARFLWLSGGAGAMGFGIWSMHYIGMLAFRLPIPVQYDWPTVLLSLLAAILASAIALIVVSRQKMGMIRALAGSVVMGGGIATMHYTGMAAMRLQAMCSYSPVLVTLSVVLAIVISLVALFLTFHFRGDTSAWNWRKVVSALVMGAAIPVMHYTAMAAASFTASPSAHQDLAHAVSVSSLSVAGISIVTFVVLGTVLLTSLRFDSLSNTRQLTARYFLSLGAISLLAIVGTVLVERQSQQSRSDARLVNIAGRQRMLSQTIAKDALLLTRSESAAERERLLEDLRSAAELWEDSHSALKNEDGVPGVSGTNSPQVRQMFAALDPDYTAMVSATQALLAKLPAQETPGEVAAEVKSILDHEGPYLRTMNDIVFQYEREATLRDDRKNQLHFGLLLSILGVLLVQGLVVLRPALVRIQQGISQLELAKRELYRKATFVELLQVVAVAANEAASVDAALQFTLDRVCEHTGWPVGHVYLCPSGTSTELASTTLWHLDNALQFETFRQVTEKTPLAMGAGLPGRVAKSGKSAWIADINEDTNFPRKKLAADLGVKGAFGFPVLAQGEVVAVLEFFSSNIEEPDQELLTVMSNVGAQLGQVVERKRAEEALREAEARYRLLVEQLPAVPYVAEPGAEGQWLYVSPRIESILGFTPAEWTADRHLWFRQVHPEDREGILAEEKASEARGEAFHFEYRMFARDGRVVWIHDAAALVPDAVGGRPLQHGVLFDISERKRAEQELASKAEELARSNAEKDELLENAARFRIVAEAATDAIVAIDSESRFLFVNPAAERIFGYQHTEMLGQSLTMLMPPGFRELHKAGLERYVATGQKRLNWASVEVAGRHKSGAEIPVEISFGEFSGEGRRMFAAVIRDITERKRTERELARRAEELERSNAELELFAYVASHDLQEPLRMVASYTQLLARRYKGKLGAEADEFIGFAVDGANRMQQLIQDLLSYSRLTTRGKALSLTQAEAACNSALENLQESIKESNAQVSVGPLPGVFGDATQLTQLSQNLIGNAIKYRNERRPEIRVAARPNGNEWTFSVQDNGIGIEPQYAERIFQMFQRLHTRAEYSGTGIGLAVCRKIVERHGGRIWVESQPGGGSTFLFTIPRVEERTAK